MRFQRNFMFAACYFNLNVYISFSSCPPLHTYSHLHVGCPYSFSSAIRDIWMNKSDRLREGLC